MDPLFALFNPIVAMLNRQIAEVTPARELCARLDTRTIAVRVRNTALAVALTAGRDRLDLNTLEDAEPDVVITGSLLSLARLAGEDGEALIKLADQRLYAAKGAGRNQVCSAMPDELVSLVPED